MTNPKDEEAAKKWASERCPGQDSGDIVWCMSKEDFLAGCQHARAEQKELMEWATKTKEKLKGVIKMSMAINVTVPDELVQELDQILPEEK